jgi:pilus assembly protein CpaF
MKKLLMLMHDLSDGSRVHAIIPPCALQGGTITIRKFPENQINL